MAWARDVWVTVRVMRKKLLRRKRERWKTILEIDRPLRYVFSMPLFQTLPHCLHQFDDVSTHAL
jgi:hypothetical protein